jgi:hypothetical protein
MPQAAGTSRVSDMTCLVKKSADRCILQPHGESPSGPGTGAAVAKFSGQLANTQVERAEILYPQ